MQKTQKSKAARAVMDKAMEKMRVLLESGNRNRSDSEEMAVVLADEIVNAKDLSDEEQNEIIK